MICPGPSEIYPAPLLFLSKHTRKFKKRKKRKKNGEKKRALRKTRIYNYYVPTKRSRCKAQVTPHCGEARWRRCGSARHRFTAQNFGIRTLDAARDCRIPTSDLFRWLKAQSNSTASREQKFLIEETLQGAAAAASRTHTAPHVPGLPEKQMKRHDLI